MSVILTDNNCLILMCYDANVSKAWKQTKHTEVTDWLNLNKEP